MGRSLWSLPDGAGGRFTQEFDFEGNYTVDEEGFSITTASGGVFSEVIIVITRSKRFDGRRIAVELQGFTGQPGPSGGVPLLRFLRQVQ